MTNTTAPRVWDILEYVEHTDGLGLRLYPVQRFILKLYYGLPLGDTERTITVVDPLGNNGGRIFTEVEYLKYLHSEGRCNIKEPDHLRNELVLVIGRRGGKTVLSAIIASYEIYRLLNCGNPQERYGLFEGAMIQVLTVSNDKEQAGNLFNEQASHLGKCNYFKPYIANNTVSYIQFRTPHDIERYGATERSDNGKMVSHEGKARLRSAFKSCIAKGLRGHCNATVIFDEMAHYPDIDGVTAKDVYDAAVPSTASFYPKLPGVERIWEARIVSLSSPDRKSGKFYDLFSRAMSNDLGYNGALALQIPTWEINPTVPGKYYQHCWQRDRETFDSDFGAKFRD